METLIKNGGGSHVPLIKQQLGVNVCIYGQVSMRKVVG